MNPRLLTLVALLLASALGRAEDDNRRHIEVAVTVAKARPGGGNDVVSSPSVVCPEGEECKLFVGQTLGDGKPDNDAIRIEVTPTLTEDGRIRIQLVSLGTELGERPGGEGAKDKPGATPKLTFHSALPAEGLFSVAGANGTRSWLRLGQSVDGWKLSVYEPATRTLILSRERLTFRLPLASASVGAPTEASGRRTEVLNLLPGEQGQILGRNGMSLTVTAKVYADKTPAR